MNDTASSAVSEPPRRLALCFRRVWLIFHGKGRTGNLRFVALTPQFGVMRATRPSLACLRSWRSVGLADQSTATCI